MTIFSWGKRKENGLWWYPKSSRYRFMFSNHDSLYIAVGHLRFRLMKPKKRVTGDDT